MEASTNRLLLSTRRPQVRHDVTEGIKLAKNDRSATALQNSVKHAHAGQRL